MSRRLHQTVGRWLREERRGAAAAADAALRRVFRALPAPAPSAGFVERVMVGAGLAPARPAPAALGWRIVISASLVLAAGAAAAAPGLALRLLRSVSPGALIRLGAEGVVETCQRLAEGLAVWQTLTSIGETLSQVLTAPPILAALLAATLLSAGGFRLLHGLLAVDRRAEDVRA